MLVLAITSRARSAHTLTVQLGVYSVSAFGRSELGQDPPSRFPASAGTYDTYDNLNL